MRPLPLLVLPLLAACETPEQPRLLTYSLNPICLFFCEVAVEQVDDETRATGGSTVSTTTTGGDQDLARKTASSDTGQN